jgi:hypothetical protein
VGLNPLVTRQEDPVGDVIFVALTLALFGLAWLLVRACERIIGPEEVTALSVAHDEEAEVAA